MIKRHFDDRGWGIGGAARGVYGEGGGVVVGMTALIGMREHGGRRFRAQHLGEAADQVGQISPGLLVGDAETEPAQSRGVARVQRRRQLRLTRRGVIRDASEAIIAGVLGVARRAVGDMDKRRVREPAELRAETDRLVVGVRDDDHDALRDRAVARETREDCLVRAHSPAATASGAYAEPARQ